jgi:hypothetical protein
MFLLNDGSTSIDLDDRTSGSGIALSKKDIGAPEVREVTYALASADGVDDQTRYLGQRVVAITGKCFRDVPNNGSRSIAWERMSHYLDPAKRITLQYQFDSDSPVRQASNLRMSQFSRIASSPTGFDFTIQWKADPVVHETIQEAITLTPTGLIGGQGRSYSLSFPRMYPTSGAGSPGLAVTDGDYKTWPVYEIHGPCTNPVITMTDPGSGATLGIVAVHYTIPSGHYFYIDSRSRTVFYDGTSGSSYYQYLDFTQTVWSPMLAGSTQFTFVASGAQPGSYCKISWYDAYLY